MRSLKHPAPQDEPSNCGKSRRKPEARWQSAATLDAAEGEQNSQGGARLNVRSGPVQKAYGGRLPTPA
jgi:hypothetical protein